MVFAKSDNVITYPVSNRTGVYSIQSRLTNEYNITNSINQLKDADSFVVEYAPDPSTNSSEDNSYIDFCIAGYYFRVKRIDPFKSGKLPLYAYVELTGLDVKTAGNKFKYYSQELDVIEGSSSESGISLDVDISTAGDPDYEFKGLAFDINKPTVDHYLQLFDENGKIPQDSLIKLRTNASYRSVVIDDGDLDAPN